MASLGALVVARSGREGPNHELPSLERTAPSCNLIIGALLLPWVLWLFRHRTLVGMLISGELIMAGAALNFMAFGHFGR